MIKAFGHTAKRAGIEILVRPNATGKVEGKVPTSVRRPR